MKPLINYTNSIKALLPSHEILQEQTFVELLRVCDDLIQVPVYRALIIYQNSRSTHILLLKRSYSIQISVIDPSLSDETIGLIKNILGTSNFRLTENVEEGKRCLYLAMENKIDSLSELIKVAFSMNNSRKQFSVNIYKDPLRISRTA